MSFLVGQQNAENNESRPRSRMRIEDTWKWSNTIGYRWHTAEIFPPIIRCIYCRIVRANTRVRVMPRGGGLISRGILPPESWAYRKSMLPRATRIMRQHCIASRELLTHCSSPTVDFGSRWLRRESRTELHSCIRARRFDSLQRIDYRKFDT